MVKIHTFETATRLVEGVIGLLYQTLPTAGNLMLSGGTTPYTTYNRIASSPCPVHTNRNLFLSDERMVPSNDPKNNAGNLDPMLSALQCDDRFIRVDTGLPMEEAAQKYAHALEFLNPIDLGLLGMGNDGHTAGLFAKEQAQLTSGPLVISSRRPDGMEGVSETPALLHRVERIILLVSGESKRAMVNTLIQDPDSIPAGIALSGHPGVELWTDLRVG